MIERVGLRTSLSIYKEKDSDTDSEVALSCLTPVSRKRGEAEIGWLRNGINHKPKLKELVYGQIQGQKPGEESDFTLRA